MMKKKLLWISLILILSPNIFASSHVELDLPDHSIPLKIVSASSNNLLEQTLLKDQPTLETRTQIKQDNVMDKYQDREGRTYCFEWLGEAHHLEAILDVVDKNYIQREPVSRQLGLNHSVNYKNLVKQNIIDSLKKNLVLIAKHQGEIAACSINNDYFEDILNESDDVDADDLKVFSAFFDELENPFIEQISPIKNRDIFYSNMGCVDQQYLGSGLSTQIAERFTSKAFELGYKYSMAIPTSEQTQNTLIKKLNYELVSGLSCKDFTYKGQKPFKSADEKARCVLAVKRFTAKL